MSGIYRPLLPAPQSSQRQATGSYSTPSSGVELNKRRRVGTRLACNECRRRKTRCDAQRPRCEACRGRGEKDPCVYEDQSDKTNNQGLELLELLKIIPENQAYDVLRVFRSHGDPANVLQMFKESRGQDRTLSEAEGAQVDTRHLELEFELMSRSPVAFPPVPHVDSSQLRSVISTSHAARADIDSSDPPQKSKLLSNDLFNHSPPSKDPLPIPSLCDKRLEDLNMAYWTSVPVSNGFGGRVISLYLRTDHPLLGTFDPDLFVGDLVSGRLQFCSRFLVNAVMYWGCQMYSSLDPAASRYVDQFGEEAERLRLDEQSTDSLLNLAAIQLLGLAYLGHGKDHYVLKYVSEANAMGTRIGLFGVNPTAAINRAREIPDKLRSSTSYAAWGTFNWIILMSLFYQQPGLAYPAYPPSVPIPGQAGHGSFDGSVESVQKSVHSSFMGDTFPALCQFWTIVHEVTLRYYRDNPPPRGQLRDRIDLSFAEYKYRELIVLVENLPASMIQCEQSPHHVIVFQCVLYNFDLVRIWFHAAILDIFRPFTSGTQHTAEPLRLKTFSAIRGSVDAAFRASIDQLKRLIVTYRSKYACSTYTMLWHTALIYVVNAMFQSGKDPVRHSYLLFSIQCYKSLRESYRFAEAAGRSLLTMALQNQGISVGEARHFMQQFEEKRLDQTTADIRATFMVDLNLAMTDPDEASVETLANKFEYIALFEELTNQDVPGENEMIDLEEQSF